MDRTTTADRDVHGREPDHRTTVERLRLVLRSKSSSAAAVARAAEEVGQLELSELCVDLRAAFEQFFNERKRADKHCLTKIAITVALRQLKCNDIDVFVKGMNFYWRARPGNHIMDEAVRLRIAAALAYAELGSPAEVDAVGDLLADPVSDVRLAAVRSLVVLGGPRACSLLRLKANFGDESATVVDECFDGLLNRDGTEYIPFVARFLEREESPFRLAAVLALGRTGDARALDALIFRWDNVTNAQFKSELLMAIALIGNESSVRFLLELLDQSPSNATDAMAALVYSPVPGVRDRVQAAVERHGDDVLCNLFKENFPEGR